MSVLQRAKAKYSITVALSTKDSMARMLLADGVSSELYNLVEDPSGKDKDYDYYKKLKDGIERSQTNIGDNVEEVGRKLGMTLNHYLPYTLLTEMAKEWTSTTGVPFDTVPEKERHRICLSCLGHGVTPFDDVEFFDWLEEAGFDGKEIETKWRHHRHFENDYNKTWEWLADAVKAMKNQEVK
jgi:hypothetical protein